ncbi:hypothetical protein AVEN_124916-1 [Araneus ventricosus]|uniref:Uncharacterized protein n=1 Tax=Araneus ventricosus TaxID=182803 RepID=A0A4Y2M4T6_ARAVE|nr:hypothetical protein AVEN_124916-1 [Araneus ventricosus]
MVCIQKRVCEVFGNRKSYDFVARVEELLSAYKAIRCNISLKCFSFTHTWTFSLKILEQFRMNTRNGSIKTLLSSRGDFQGMHVGHNTSGHWYEKFLLQGTREKQAPDEGTLL